MSPQNIVTETRSFLTDDIQNQIPNKLRGLFSFGVRAFTLQPLTSCNGNARLSHAGSKEAAQQQMYRLLRHPRLFLLVWRVVAKQIELSADNLVNVDYSNLGPLAILGFGRQNRRGRATPVLMRSLASNTQGQKKTHPKYKQLKEYYREWRKQVQADQYTFVIKSLRLLRRLYGCQPRLVFDRGFVNQGLVEFLCRSQWLFYLRMKGGYLVEYAGEKHKVNRFTTGEYQVVWAGQQLRLVVGRTRKRHPEPWYILTNDTKTPVPTVCRYYYHRFEIEESFRDIKSLLRLKGSRVRTWRSLRTILCFMSLALICALDLPGADPPGHLAATGNHVHPKKTLSLVRIWQEAVQRTLRAPALADWGLG